MALLLSKSELSRTEPAERAAFNAPVPTQIVSNGEFNPLPQTARRPTMPSVPRVAPRTRASPKGR